MTKQSLQLSTLTLAGSLTTLLRTQFSSALEPRNLFLLVADIYRRISFLPTKIQTYIMNDNRPLKIDKKTLTGQDRTTANTSFTSGGVTCIGLTESALCFYSSAVQVDLGLAEMLRNPPPSLACKTLKVI